MARGYDSRAYPEIPLSIGDLRRWDSAVAQFEAKDPNKSDGPGDTYYFWTHCYVALITSLSKNFSAKAIRLLFSQGIPIMRVVRKLVGDEMVTTHKEASTMGRKAGFMLAKLLDEKPIS
ncbi:hypothetical protein A3B46_03450 [Candidatus Roizmanbacteria bacterium RIFCSPLOWO2_01_FULL_39_19]|nr:MAG: hypothetical protein A3B46_03450 [Candidatus Roizmanbacteria bacterium RIFCSPLOWO2_01_FULL_39_19]